MNESGKISKVTDQRFLSTDHQSSAISRQFIYAGKSCRHDLTQRNTTIRTEYFTTERIYTSRLYLPSQNPDFREYGFLLQNWIQLGSRKRHTNNLTIIWILINYYFIQDYYYKYTRKVKQIFHSQPDGVMTKGRPRYRSVILNTFRCPQSLAFQIVLSQPLKKSSYFYLSVYFELT